MCCTEWINFEKHFLLLTIMGMYKSEYKQEALIESQVEILSSLA